MSTRMACAQLQYPIRLRQLHVLLLPLVATILVVMDNSSGSSCCCTTTAFVLPSISLSSPQHQQQHQQQQKHKSFLWNRNANHETDDDDENNNNNNNEMKNQVMIADYTRRAFVTTSMAGIVTATTAATTITTTPPANAADPNKIVLSTYTSPPSKYATGATSSATMDTSMTTTKTNNGDDATSSSLCTATATTSDMTDEDRRILIFERAAPSVVFIDTFTQQRDEFSTNVLDVPLGSGSGFVWDDRGHIVTNYHVVRNAKSAQVAILTRVFNNNNDDDENNGKSMTPSKMIPSIRAGGGGNKRSLSISQRQKEAPSSSLKQQQQQQLPLPTSMRPSKVLTDYKRSVYKARVIGVDPSKDIAVLKVDAPVYDLYPIDIGSSSSIRVGQTALAIGNPFGLDHSMTAGIISGIGREVRSPMGQPISNVIQTDAAINPGNSGGPLLDSSGRIIGMNTAIYSPSGGSAGIGFAIPIDTVSYIVQTLIRDGKIVRPVIGISYLQTKQARALGISKGVLVLDVPKDSPAYRAGMKGTRRTESGLIEIGDIIVKVADTDIDTEADLFTALENYKPGDRVNIVVNRLEPSGGSFKAQEIVLSVQLKASETKAISFGDDSGDVRRYHE